MLNTCPTHDQVTLTNPAEAREALDVMVNLVGANNLKAEKVTHTLSHRHTHEDTHTNTHTHTHTHNLSFPLSLSHTHTLSLYPSIPSPSLSVNPKLVLEHMIRLRSSPRPGYEPNPKPNAGRGEGLGREEAASQDLQGRLRHRANRPGD